MATFTRSAVPSLGSTHRPPGAASRADTLTSVLLVGRTLSNRSVLCAWLALLSVLAIVEIEAWDLIPEGNTWHLAVAVPIATAMVLLFRMTATSVGRRPFIQSFHNSAQQPWSGARTWITVASVTGCLIVVLIAGGEAIRCEGESFRYYWLDKPPLRIVAWIGEKTGVVIAQQLALQGLLVPCFAEITRSYSGRITRRAHAHRALACGAIVFGLVHLPSLAVVALTSIGAYAWSYWYRRSGRILPLIASHLALAIVAHGALPERLNYNMRIGADALTKHDLYRQLESPPLGALTRLLCSDRYYNSCGAIPERFVECLYKDALGVPPTGQTCSEMVGKLRARCRADIVADLCASEPFAIHRRFHADEWFERRAREVASRLARSTDDLACHHNSARTSRHRP